MTEAQVRQRFERAYTEAGSYRKLAKQWKVSAVHLYRMHRRQTPFTAQVLKHLGVRVEHIYRDMRE